MTLQEAKDLTIGVWSYLRDNPECRYKFEISTELYNKIENLDHQCPLCDTFYCIVNDDDDDDDESGNTACPLFPCIVKEYFTKYSTIFCKYPGAYEDWLFAKTTDQRAIAAGKIVEMTKEWII